jgi:hypothetical protein
MYKGALKRNVNFGKPAKKRPPGVPDGLEKLFVA